jgi:hypothetical protein
VDPLLCVIGQEAHSEHHANIDGHSVLPVKLSVMRQCVLEGVP